MLIQARQKGKNIKRTVTSAASYLLGDMAKLCCFIAERRRAMPPQALGDDIEVPFMSWRTCSVHWGTGAIAPPGADSTTPVAPSGVGPLLDQVYCCPCSRVREHNLMFSLPTLSWCCQRRRNRKVLVSIRSTIQVLPCPKMFGSLLSPKKTTTASSFWIGWCSVAGCQC